MSLWLIFFGSRMKSYVPFLFSGYYRIYIYIWVLFFQIGWNHNLENQRFGGENVSPAIKCWYEFWSRSIQESFRGDRLKTPQKIHRDVKTFFLFESPHLALFLRPTMFLRLHFLIQNVDVGFFLQPPIKWVFYSTESCCFKGDSDGFRVGSKKILKILSWQHQFPGLIGLCAWFPGIPLWTVSESSLQRKDRFKTLKVEVFLNFFDQNHQLQGDTAKRKKKWKKVPRSRCGMAVVCFFMAWRLTFSPHPFCGRRKSWVQF